jgi:hypothetical protein
MVKNGGAAIDAQDDTIVLSGFFSSNNKWTWFNRGGVGGSVAAYQVTSGKSFYVTEVRISIGASAATGTYISVGYADNAVAGYDQAAFTPTNMVPIFGSPTGAGYAFNNYVATMASSVVWQGCLKAVAATKYPYAYLAAGGTISTSILLEGYEA